MSRSCFFENCQLSGISTAVMLAGICGISATQVELWILQYKAMEGK